MVVVKNLFFGDTDRFRRWNDSKTRQTFRTVGGLELERPDLDKHVADLAAMALPPVPFSRADALFFGGQAERRSCGAGGSAPRTPSRRSPSSSAWRSVSGPMADFDAAFTELRSRPATVDEQIEAMSLALIYQRCPVLDPLAIRVILTGTTSLEGQFSSISWSETATPHGFAKRLAADRACLHRGPGDGVKGKMAHLVWFKRDLRIDDHEALATATARGDCVLLYVYEPEYYAMAEFDPSHHHFIDESLAELEAAIAGRGGRLTYRVGAMPDVLDALAAEVVIESLHSHEETGNAITYARDRRVRAWCRARGIDWREYAQTGVIRRLSTRVGWAKRWEARMLRPIVATPAWIDVATLAPERRRTLAELGIANRVKPEAVPGGSSLANAMLESFLAERGVDYRKGMSSPLSAWESCSRLSPYLAYGTISLKRVYQATLARERELRARKAAGESIDARWLGSLRSFTGRLHWHCHFMQKLEDQPSLEFENQARAYDGLREDDFNAERFEAWKAGMTGYPMIDACMRALHRGGWINFRMRAMLMSFASYHLWLHWRRTAVYLGSQFLDFEAGIHYPQAQMQSGTTGINALRIYSPTKQVLDHDPTGIFIRRYVDELASVPAAFIAEPHAMPPIVAASIGFRSGIDYPAPIVDHKRAVAFAKERVYGIRRGAAAKSEAQAVYEKHGSRKPTAPRSLKPNRPRA